ncbi:hypothetical protein D3C87_1537000 [compost metagenome]
MHHVPQHRWVCRHLHLWVEPVTERPQCMMDKTHAARYQISRLELEVAAGYVFLVSRNYRDTQCCGVLRQQGFFSSNTVITLFNYKTFKHVPSPCS